MSTEYSTIPKFRKVLRLVCWVSYNKTRERLPRDREEIFFKEYREGKLNLGHVVSYSAHVGALPEMEFMLLGSDKIVAYAKNCRSHGRMICDALRDSITDEGELVSYARNFGRLPPHLEDRITSPVVAVSYSESVVRGRLPEDMEKRIFCPKGAYQVFQYAKNNRFLPEGHLYECLKGSSVAIVEHMKWLRSNSMGNLPDDLRDCLAGDDDSLLEWAKIYGRLPEHLERTLSKPKACLEYAAKVLRGRLPLEVESCLLKDHKTAVNYAFTVIRGFAPCRLPEEIHASIVMKSFEHIDDQEIKRYIAACDSDPNRMGNK